MSEIKYKDIQVFSINAEQLREVLDHPTDPDRTDTRISFYEVKNGKILPGRSYHAWLVMGENGTVGVMIPGGQVLAKVS